MSRLTDIIDATLAAADPAKPFVAGPVRTLTYGGLKDAVARVGALLDAWGIGPGDRIVASSAHDLELIGLFYGAVRAGVSVALIDADASPDEARALVKAAEPKAVFADARLLGDAALRAAALAGARILAVDPDPAAVAPAGADGTYPAVLGAAGAPAQGLDDGLVAMILFTSGTTSRPKGVELTHANLSAHLATWLRHYGYGPSCRLLNGLPLHHTDGLTHGPSIALAAGATVYRPGRFSVQQVPELFRLLKDEAITHFITVPTVLALMLRVGEDHRDAFKGPAFRCIRSNAGPLNEQLWRDFEAHFGVEVVNAYGLTETVCEGIYCGPTRETRRMGTIGKPVDIEVRLVDGEGRDVAQGETGEILIRGDCVMRGYYKAPEETAAALRDGWLVTGDLARLDADGFVWIVGRKKNVIITGGINVYPEDVTRTVQTMPGVRDAATVGVPDETWGERVVTCVEADARAVTPEQVVAWCQAKLAKEKVPSRVFVVDKLPRGPVGKIVLPEVRRMVASLDGQPAAPASAFSMDHEFDVYKLAAGAFKVHFRELSPESSPDTVKGWDSLAHVDFLVALEKRFKVKFSPKDIMNIRTLGNAIDALKTKL